jgi:hypothetical protein
MSRNQFIENLRKSKYADLAKNSLRLVILEQHTEIEALERQLEEAREFAEEMLDSGYFESSIGLSYVKRLEQLKEKGDEQN